VEVARAVLGGRGLGAYLLLRERVYDVDPLAPANPLIFAPGPLTGSAAPAAGRYSVSSRSPLTGTVFDGNSGGAFGVAVRRLGLDYLVVEGACEAPSYLLIGDDGVRLLPAGELWGADVPAALARLRELHGRAEAAVIGPAGERGVLFASIVNNRGRQIGRGGLGAVMGAKSLKAIVLAVEGGSLPGPAIRSASRRSSARPRPNCAATPSPAARCPTSAPRCCSTSSTRSALCRPATSANPASSRRNRSAARRCVPAMRPSAAPAGVASSAAPAPSAPAARAAAPRIRESLGAGGRLRHRGP